MPDTGRYTLHTLVPYKFQWAHEVGHFTHEWRNTRVKGTHHDLWGPPAPLGSSSEASTWLWGEPGNSGESCSQAPQKRNMDVTSVSALRKSLSAHNEHSGMISHPNQWHSKANFAPVLHPSVAQRCPVTPSLVNCGHLILIIMTWTLGYNKNPFPTLGEYNTWECYDTQMPLLLV